MKKYVVISSNENDSYLFLTVIVSWAWNKLGWNVISIIPYYSNNYSVSKSELISESMGDLCKENIVRFLPDMKENIKRTETIAQCCRLYACGCTDGMIMTSDADMLPLSNYWHPHKKEITAYGRDLSDRHYPICYVAMDADEWFDTLNVEFNMEESLIKDFSKREDVNSGKWEEWWQADQNFLTEKLNSVKVTRIDRGIQKTTGYPIGRIDRSAWEKSLLQTERIDAHLFRDGYKKENWIRILSLIKECFNPTGEEIKWMQNYRNQYLKLL